MAKQRSMNELRQEKTYGYRAPFNMTAKEDDGLLYEYPAVPKGDVEDHKKQKRGYSEIDIETTKDLIFNQLKNQLFDIMFQAVNDEMAKHEVFQAETYFTPQGEEWFEDQWFEFYHEHHGDILGSIMKDFTN